MLYFLGIPLIPVSLVMKWRICKGLQNVCVRIWCHTPWWPQSHKMSGL